MYLSGGIQAPDQASPLIINTRAKAAAKLVVGQTST